MTSEFRKIPQIFALKYIQGTCLRDRVYGVTYKDLVRLFGPPSFYPQDYNDEKSYYGWVVLWEDKYYHIYDWKTYDEDYTLTELDVWNIGAKRGDALQDLGFARAVLHNVNRMKLEVA